MTAPSVAFTTLALTATDVDSPLDETLMTAYRNNDIHLYEWIGYGYTPAQAHDHDGVNSKLLPSVIMGNLFAFRHYT
jgi:hypothetical protein